jgi:hypothetical protein
VLFGIFYFAPVGQLATVRREQGSAGTSGRLQSFRNQFFDKDGLGKVKLLSWAISGDFKTDEAVGRSRCHFKKAL